MKAAPVRLDWASILLLDMSRVVQCSQKPDPLIVYGSAIRFIVTIKDTTMPVYAKYPIPHFLGKVSYPADTRMKPDGDTVHLFNPVLLVNGKALPPNNGGFAVWVTGATKPKIVRVRGKGAHTYIPIRFAGIDAPKEHYRATAFKIKLGGQERSFPLNPDIKHEDRSQPLWSPATKYAVGTLTKAGWGLAAPDSDVIDRYGRVLGYMYASDAKGSQN